MHRPLQAWWKFLGKFGRQGHFRQKKQLSHDQRIAKRGEGHRIQFKEMQRDEPKEVGGILSITRMPGFFQ